MESEFLKVFSNEIGTKIAISLWPVGGNKWEITYQVQRENFWYKKVAAVNGKDTSRKLFESHRPEHANELVEQTLFWGRKVRA